LARPKAVRIFKDESLDLEARIIGAIGAVGPRNVAQLSRMTRAHQETIRYKIKKRFAGRGFRFQAEVDYGKLGLRLHWATIEVSPVYYASAPKFFNALNRGAYLIHFSKILPSGHFVALFALPVGRGTEFLQFLENLKARKIIVDFRLDEVVAQRHKAMDVNYFDFQASRWEVDWQKVRASPESPLPFDKATQQRQLADEFDMQIIKELEINALQHTTGIARKLRAKEKTLEYHYRTHVSNEGLIPRYRVRWMRDRSKTVAHSLMVVRMTFMGLEEKSYRKVQGVISKIPYLWVEDRLRDGTYIATLAVPVADAMDMMGYVNDELQFLGPRAETGFMRVGDSYNYTIPYHMFSDGEWKFQPKAMERVVLRELSRGLKK
jgi:DNA-binding Lrp family transcriptional regulator